MEWLLVSPYNISEEVQLYGKPTVAGEWKIINTVLNPRAEHIYKLEFTVGKSITESTTSSFEFRWETSASASIGFASFSTSASLTAKVEKTSSSTWREEKKVTRQIKISPGKSVVTWQYVFSGEQCDHKAIFRSNILADTGSTTETPDERADKELVYI
ncbi:hypothetical protein ScPMuIL_011314 [Solemya velum]